MAFIFGDHDRKRRCASSTSNLILCPSTPTTTSSSSCGLTLLLVAAAVCAGAAATPTIAMRKNYNDLTPGEVLFVRLGLQQMRLLPLTDPRNAIYQANLHGNSRNLTHDYDPDDLENACTEEDLLIGTCQYKGPRIIPVTLSCAPAHSDEFADAYPQNEAWGQCQHGSFYFLPWHRLALAGFEKILRAQAVAAIDSLLVELPEQEAAELVARLEDSPDTYDLGLPYWDYSDEGGWEFERPSASEDKKLPAALREGAPCSDGTEGMDPSPLVDVVRGNCNPLKVSDSHRRVSCNQDKQCILNNTNHGDDDSLYDAGAGYDRASAVPALNMSCSYECNPGAIDGPCPEYACVRDGTAVFYSFHGLEKNTSLPPTDFFMNSGEDGGILETTPHSAVHFTLGNMINEVRF